ncbi:MAG: thioredoxin-dependent thiol peroxidase [Succinivibrionaceae bacterium]
MALLNVGSKIPNITLKDQNNNDINLIDISKNLTLLYFYPKALTSGCTTQACAIRDAGDELKSRNLTVYGISPDNVTKIQKFITKENLNFSLLADENHSACEAFGVWDLKKMYGKEYYGVLRTSFLVKDGVILEVFPKVKPKEHLSKVLEYFDNYLEK